MLFASTELVARIEAAECGLLRASADAVSAARPEVAVLKRDIGGGIATWAGPESPLNKVAGLGFGGPVDEGALEGVEAAFAQRGSPVQVELATLADPAVGEMLTARGYRLVAFENVLGRALPAASTGTAEAVRVDRSRPLQLRRPRRRPGSFGCTRPPPEFAVGVTAGPASARTRR